MRICGSSFYLGCPDPIWTPCIHFYWDSVNLGPFGLSSPRDWTFRSGIWSYMDIYPEEPLEAFPAREEDL